MDALTLTKEAVKQRFQRLAKVGLLATGAAVASTIALKSSQSAHASSDVMQAPKYPWTHRYPWQAFDHASIRRGFQVYQQVCATCHTLDYIAYRNLVNTCYTEEEVKAIAAETEFEDGPNEEGDMYKRPGRLSDYMPRPYPNEQAARFANNGAYPPDLSLMVKARGQHEDYLFALLTGYRDPPHGVKIREGLYYNPYFPGGAIAMPRAIADGMITYDDGTPNSVSQLSKDVSTFLAWAAEPEHDVRKQAGFKTLTLLVLMAIPTYYYKRLKWAAFKSQVVTFKPHASLHKLP
jgi:ubiquinol-cytochrome c reductase cytochrome c1 subunit